MKDIVTKINNNPTSAGSVEDFEYNDTFRELSNAVKTFIPLDGQDEKQLSKSIDIASKAMFYGDIGSVNNVHLTRGATSEQIETLVDGIVVIFSVANNNTGSTTIKLNALDAKTALYNGLPLVAGVLKTGFNYIGVYSLSLDAFNVVFIGDVPDNSITTAKLVNNSVSFAKLAHGTPYQYFGFNVNGSPTQVDPPMGIDQSWYRNSTWTGKVNYTNSSNQTTFHLITTIGASNDNLFINDTHMGRMSTGSGEKHTYTIALPDNDTIRVGELTGTDDVEMWHELR